VFGVKIPIGWVMMALGFLLTAVPNAMADSPWNIGVHFDRSAVEGWVQVRENAQEGTRLHLEKDLGIHSSTTIDLDLAYRFSEKRRLTFTVGTTLLRGDKTQSGLVFFDESSYPAGSRLRSDPLFYHLRLTYRQTIWKPRRGGLHLLAGLEYDYLNFTVQGVNTSGELDRQGEDFWKQEFPIPFVGIEARYKAAERWWFGMSSTYGGWNNVNTLRKEGGTVRLTQKDFDTRLLIGYQASPRLSFNAGYRFYSFDQEEQSNEDGNRIHIRTHGPLLEAAYRF
jgi:hypothetical protein